MTEARANRRRRALEASGILRCQWPLKAEGKDDVDETAAGLWRAREDASWEVRLALRPRLPLLFEIDFPVRTLPHAPSPESPLQRPQLPGLQLPRMAPLQLLEHHLRLQSRIRSQQCLRLWPQRFQRILPGPPVPRWPGVARKLPASAPFASRALAHTRFRRRRCQRLVPSEFLHQ